MSKPANEINSFSTLSIKSIAGLLAAGILLFGTVACGKEGNQRGEEESLETWGKDSHLRWDRSEFIAAANSVGLYSAWNDNEGDLLIVSGFSKGVFNIYGENKDNLIDRKKFATWDEAWSRRVYANCWDVVDKNMYTREEVYNAFFAALDTNGDSYLTKEDYRQINNYMRGT